MIQSPEKSDCCMIREFDDYDGHVYQWDVPDNEIFRFFAILFLTLWLFVWCVGGIVVVYSLTQGIRDGKSGSLFFFICAASVGIVFATYALYGMLRSPRPEAIVLSDTQFQYDPGHIHLAMSLDGLYSGQNRKWMYGNPYQNYVSQYPNSRLSFFSRSLTREYSHHQKRFKITKSELGPVVLKQVGQHVGLFFDYQGEQIEIGEFLSSLDREWLATVIVAWQRS